MASWMDTPEPSARPGEPVIPMFCNVDAWWDLTLLLDRQGVGLLLANADMGFAYLAVPEHCVARLTWPYDHGCDECVYWSVTADRTSVAIEWLTPKLQADIESTYADCWLEVRGDVFGPLDPDDDPDQWPDDYDAWNGPNLGDYG